MQRSTRFGTSTGSPASSVSGKLCSYKLPERKRHSKARPIWIRKTQCWHIDAERKNLRKHWIPDTVTFSSPALRLKIAKQKLHSFGYITRHSRARICRLWCVAFYVPAVGVNPRPLSFILFKSMYHFDVLRNVDNTHHDGRSSFLPDKIANFFPNVRPNLKTPNFIWNFKA